MRSSGIALLNSLTGARHDLGGIDLSGEATCLDGPWTFQKTTLAVVHEWPACGWIRSEQHL